MDLKIPKIKIISLIISFFALNANASEMLTIPSGHFFMGKNNAHHGDQSPRHDVSIDSFLIDDTLVTNKDFKSFVETTHYSTTAEKKGYGMVAYEGLQNWEWKKIKGASWKNPFGPNSNVEIKDDFPVVSVSWEDADAYCKYLGKRLPTEAEWEYAAGAGTSDQRFPWGNDYHHHGKIGLNFWQGSNHTKNEKLDGYLYMSPVKAFAPNKWGLYDPVGNVWQWVQDWYSSTEYLDDAKSSPTKNPQGPSSGTRRVSRGGSWWCSETTCDGFGLFFRGKAHPEATFNNNGFRCAKSIVK